MMTKAEAAELILAARRMSARVGQVFVVDRQRLSAMGPFTESDIARIERAVDEIEDATAAALNELHL
jgi:hypothetical protein